MDKKPYAVVYFLLEEMYSEIPTNWLLDDKRCFWPKTINARNLMLKNTKPDPNTWDTHDIKVEAYSSTLEGARKKAADSDYSTSNENEETGRGRRKKVPVSWTLFNNVVSSSDDDGTITPPPLLKTLDKTNSVHEQVKGLSENNTDAEIPIIFINENDINNPINTDESSNTVESVGVTDAVNAGSGITMETLHAEIVHLKAICMFNKKYLKSIHEKLNERQDIQKEPLNIPLKTLDDIRIFEEQLDHEGIRSSLVAFIKSVGGRDGKDNVYRCLGHLFSNELATQCSWFGQRGNFKIKDLAVIKILIESMMHMHHTLTHADIEKHAGEWFRLSRQRLNREKKE